MTVDVIERTRLAEKPRPQDLPPEFCAIEAQLMRRRRKDGCFLYPTTFDLGHGTAEERQRAAVSMLFLMACEFAEQPGPIMLRRDLETLRADLQATAQTLRRAVRTAVQLGLRRPHVISNEEELHNIDPLIVAAEEAHFLARHLDRALVVERDRGDMREQAIAIRVATACRWLFGRTMPGIVAALMKILLQGQTIEPHRVRDWIASRKNKKAKSASYS
jgi:hypothetical protein